MCIIILVEDKTLNIRNQNIVVTCRNYPITANKSGHVIDYQPIKTSSGNTPYLDEPESTGCGWVPVGVRYPSYKHHQNQHYQRHDESN